MSDCRIDSYCWAVAASSPGKFTRTIFWLYSDTVWAPRSVLVSPVMNSAPGMDDEAPGSRTSIAM